MATWAEVREMTRLLGGEPLSDEMVRLEIADVEGRNAQTVFALKEVIRPTFEMLLLKAPLVPLAGLDLAAVLREHGQLLAGSFGFLPTEDGGMLMLTANLPLAALDTSNPTGLPLFMHVFAGAARHLVGALAR